MWFRLSVGRNGNADPRWLLPFICRRGHVTRQEVGRIKIMDRETRVEIAPWAAERFAHAASRPAEEDEDIRIAPMARGVRGADGAGDGSGDDRTAREGWSTVSGSPDPVRRRERLPDRAARAAARRRRAAGEAPRRRGPNRPR